MARITPPRVIMQQTTHEPMIPPIKNSNSAVVEPCSPPPTLSLTPTPTPTPINSKSDEEDQKLVDALANASLLHANVNTTLPLLFDLLKTFASTPPPSSSSAFLQSKLESLRTYKQKNSANLITISSLESQNAHLSSSFDEATSSITSLSTELHSTQSALSASASSASHLQISRTSLSHSLASAGQALACEKELTSKLTGELQGVRLGLKERDLEGARLLQAVRDGEAALEIARKELEEREREKRVTDERCDKLKNEAEAAKEASKAKEEEGATLAERLGKLSCENEALICKAASDADLLQLARGEKRKIAELFKLGVGELREKLRRAVEEGEEQRRERGGAERRVEVMRVEGGEERRRLEERIEELEGGREEKEKKAVEVGVAKAEAKAEAKASVEKARHEDLLAAAKTSAANAAEQFAQGQRTVASLKIRLEEVTLEKVGMISHIEEVGGELEGAWGELKKCEAKNLAFKTDQSKLVDEVLSKSDSLASLASKILSLETELDSSLARSANLNSLYVNCRSELEANAAKYALDLKLGAERGVELAQRVAVMTAERAMHVSELGSLRGREEGLAKEVGEARVRGERAERGRGESERREGEERRRGEEARGKLGRAEEGWREVREIARGRGKEVEKLKEALKEANSEKELKMQRGVEAEREQAEKKEIAEGKLRSMMEILAKAEEKLARAEIVVGEHERNASKNEVVKEEMRRERKEAREETEELKVHFKEQVDALKDVVVTFEEEKFKRQEAEEEKQVWLDRCTSARSQAEKLVGEVELLGLKLENVTSRHGDLAHIAEGDRRRCEGLEQRVEELEGELRKARACGVKGREAQEGVSKMLMDVEGRSLQGVVEREKEIERLNRRCAVLSEAVGRLSSGGGAGKMKVEVEVGVGVDQKVEEKEETMMNFEEEEFKFTESSAENDIINKELERNENYFAQEEEDEQGGEFRSELMGLYSDVERKYRENDENFNNGNITFFSPEGLGGTKKVEKLRHEVVAVRDGGGKAKKIKVKGGKRKKEKERKATGLAASVYN